MHHRIMVRLVVRPVHHRVTARLVVRLVHHRVGFSLAHTTLFVTIRATRDAHVTHSVTHCTSHLGLFAHFLIVSRAETMS